MVLSLVAGEIALRIYHYFRPVFIFYDDSYYRFRGKPLSQYWGFRLNSRGFHDVEFAPKDDSTYRIIGIGDSFAFGAVPHEHNYLNLLGKRLRDDQFQIDVLNMGIPGTGPREYLAVLLREGLALKPDMVLLSFFVGNDFSDSHKRRLKQRWFTHSYVLSLLRYIFTTGSIYNPALAQNEKNYCDDCALFDPATYLRVEASRSSIYLEEDQTWKNQLRDTMFYLKEIQKICRSRRIDFEVVIIPDEVQVNHALQSQVRSTLPGDLQKKWNSSFPIDQLTAALRKEGVDYIDLHPAFVEASKTQTLYKPRDTHWNIAGNRLAAAIIHSKVRSRLDRLAQKELPSS